MEQRDNSGALFKNDKKSSEKAPDYKGPAMVDGQEYEIAAWVNRSAKGVTYMKLTFGELYKIARQEEDRRTTPGLGFTDDGLDESIPF